jgi:outer membrane protein TolC
MVFTLVVVPVLFVLVERRSEKKNQPQPAIALEIESPHDRGWLVPAANRIATVLVFGLALAVAVTRAAGAQGTPRTLTLDEAVAMARTNSHAVKIAKAKVRQKAAAARGARAEMLPTVTAEGSFTGSSAHNTIDIPAGALGTDGTGVPFSSKGTKIEQDGTSATFGFVTLSQPITPLFRIREGSRAAEAALEATEADAASTELDVALAVEKLYVSALVADHRREAAVAMLAARHAKQADAERAVGTGMVVDARVSEAKASALDAERDVISASNSAEDAREELFQLVGLPLDANVTLVAPAPTVALGSLGEYVALATQRRPEVIAAQAQVEQARRGTRSAKSEYVPDVAVFAKHTYQDAMAFIPSNSFSAGIQAKWTIVDFGRRSSTIEQRVAGEQMALENLAQAREKVALEVEKAYRNAVRADHVVRVARQALEARRDAERIAGGQATAGLVLVSNHSEASATRLAAESSLFEAELGARIARAELARAVGSVPGGS